MVVAYQSSEQFAPICMVSLYSLLIHNQHDKDLKVYFLSKDFSQSSLKKVQTMMKKLGFNPENASVVDINDLSERYDLVFDDYDGKWGVDSFCKLLLGKLLPAEINRVLYLDSDTIIQQNLKELYDIDMGNCVVAAVKDFLSEQYFEFFDLGKEDVYCNSGVLLVDLNNWRREQIDQRVSDYLKEKQGRVFFSEQTAVNVVCRGKIKVIDLKYNLTTIPAYLSISEIEALRKPFNAYDEQEIERAKREPAIIHYTTLFLICGRAWNIECNHPYKYLFDQCAQQMEAYSPTHASAKTLNLNRILRLIPRKWLCLAVGYYYQQTRLKKYMRYCNRKQVKE